MFGRSRSKKPQNRLGSVIGAGTCREGKLAFSGGLRGDAEVKGNINRDEAQPGTLVTNEQAKVVGQIAVSHAVINGIVVGPMVATDSLELLPNAPVSGDVEHHRIEIQLGTVIAGRLVHQAGTRAPEVQAGFKCS